jgi:hypothetical protein
LYTAHWVSSFINENLGAIRCPIIIFNSAKQNALNLSKLQVRDAAANKKSEPENIKIQREETIILILQLSSVISIIIFFIIMMASPASLRPPTDFVCSITKQLMKEPVLSRYGHHFERSAVLQHIETSNPFCPVTGNPLGPSDLIPNMTLQWKIKNWAKKNCLETAEKPEDPAGKGPRTEMVGFAAVPVLPSHFRCPLTRKIMKDPVMTKDGINFERYAILEWLQSSLEGTCPVTVKPLSRCGLVTNSILQREIKERDERYGNVQSRKEEKNNVREVASMGSSSSSLKQSSGSELVPRNMPRSIPTDLYSKDNTTRIISEGTRRSSWMLWIVLSHTVMRARSTR